MWLTTKVNIFNLYKMESNQINEEVLKLPYIPLRRTKSEKLYTYTAKLDPFDTILYDP